VARDRVGDAGMASDDRAVSHGPDGATRQGVSEGVLAEQAVKLTHSSPVSQSSGPAAVSRLFLVICTGRILVWCRRPAGEQVQRLLRLGAGLGGVDGHRQAGIGYELHRLEGEVQLADDRVMEALEPRVVAADVVRGPELPEQLAARRQLADEVGELTVVRVAAGFRAQDG